MAPGKNTRSCFEFSKLTEIHLQLDKVKEWLLQNNQMNNLATEELSSLVVRILKFQENYLGNCGIQPHMPKIPMQCFLDFEPGGGLCQIFLAAFKFQQEKRWKQIRFTHKQTADSHTEALLQLLKVIKEALIENKCFIVPNVYVKPEVNESITARVKEIIRLHQGTVTESESDATHVIYPPLDPDGESFTAAAGLNAGGNWKTSLAIA